MPEVLIYLAVLLAILVLAPNVLAGFLGFFRMSNAGRIGGACHERQERWSVHLKLIAFGQFFRCKVVENIYSLHAIIIFIINHKGWVKV